VKLAWKLWLVVVGVASGFLFYTLYAPDRQRLIDGKVRASSMVTAQLAASLSAPVDFEDADAIRTELEHVTQNTEVLWAGAFSPTGDLLGDVGDPLRAAPASKAAREEVRADVVVIARPIVGREGKPLGMAELGRLARARWSPCRVDAVALVRVEPRPDVEAEPLHRIHRLLQVHTDRDFSLGVLVQRIEARRILGGRRPERADVRRADHVGRDRRLDVLHATVGAEERHHAAVPIQSRVPFTSSPPQRPSETWKSPIASFAKALGILDRLVEGRDPVTPQILGADDPEEDRPSRQGHLASGRLASGHAVSSPLHGAINCPCFDMWRA